MGGVMTRDDIIHMARESQRERFSDGGYWFSMEVRDLAVFAALVAAAEREACAKVCDGWMHANGNDCAAAIRARGEA
jgi:hypothetical protein